MSSCGGEGVGWRLVEGEAGYVGGLDDVWVVVTLLGDGDGEVLDARRLCRV